MRHPASTRAVARSVACMARALLALGLAGCAALKGSPQPAIERNAFQRPSTPEEMSGFLAELAGRYQGAELVTIGSSAGGRPLVALALSRDVAAAARSDAGTRPLRVLIVGSQHGTEPSGGEALQILAGEVASGRRQDMSENLDLILVPDANPDGRAAHRRVNANGVNLSTNYNVASEPETQAILDALHRWHPDVLLDVHESAILKKKTLGAHGYMTDFQAQLEVANNPNVAPGLRALSERVLADSIERASAAGVPAQHYIGEITDVHQPITHGGLTVKNLRNMAAMYGTLSLLIENRLDPPGPVFPTPRNLRGRVEKQLAAIDAFLAVCIEHRAEIRAAVDHAREWRRSTADETVYLQARYAANPRQAEIVVPLRRIADGALEQHVFALHDVVERLQPLELPRAYAVTGHQEAVRRILDRHHIDYEVLSAPVDATVTVCRIRARVPVPGLHGWGYTDYELEERTRSATLPAGSLWIDLARGGSLVPLLLEPRSNGGVFQDPEYAKLLEVGKDFFIVRIE
jgi:Zinc carboxypeptidase